MQTVARYACYIQLKKKQKKNKKQKTKKNPFDYLFELITTIKLSKVKKKTKINQESIQSSTTLDRKEPRGQPFPKRCSQGCNEQRRQNDRHET